LWLDRTLGQELEAGLVRNAAFPYRVWSDQRPYNGTLAAIHQRARRLATSFVELGIGPGDAVSFQLPNWIEAVETFLATMFVGAIAVPVVHIYGPKELKFVLADTQAKLHVTVSQFRHLNYREIVEGMRTDLPALERVLYIDHDAFQMLYDAPPVASVYAGDPDVPSIIGYTSGTTSDPKGAIQTHRTVIAELLQRRCREPGDSRPIPLEPPEGSNKWLVASPVGHIAGLQTGILMPILLDRPAHFIDRWDVEAVLEALVEADLNLGAAATFFFNSFVNHPKFRPEHIKHIRYIASGGAPVPRAFGEQCDRLGVNLIRGYGSTEHPSITGSAFSDPLGKRIGTDGRPIAGVEIQLRDADGRPVPVGVPGEIYSRGPDLFVGYTDERLNEEAFDAEGWFCTGDVGVLDADGYLTITDRTKDIIIRGGENISAAEVEDALNRMSGVVEVAAVAAPDARMGEHVCAFLRLAAGVPAPTMEAVRAHLTAVGIARQKWPEELRVVDGDFDRTPSGKIKKVTLRDQLRKEANTNVR
jgi:acyl-CoA synthetase (AMP-forming)/AMP-acid ligase II